ncbi:hypothetical protein OIU76_029436 [Salix suchowensis]|nr:hypothetical protein OIU76_029436 [Salix suchowensis]
MFLTKLKRSSTRENIPHHSVRRLELSENNLVSHSPSSSWELVLLVVHYLDPKTLAAASFVSKSWSESFSSEDVWRPVCSAQYPCVYNLRHIDPTVSCRRLYGIASTAASKLRLQKSAKPHLPLNDLLFVVTADTGESSTLLALSKPCNEFQVDPSGIVKFSADI